ncbi:hypothetical protein AAMO2058_001485400 [Amorphochlora amoebiformis]
MAPASDVLDAGRLRLLAVGLVPTGVCILRNGSSSQVLRDCVKKQVEERGQYRFSDCEVPIFLADFGTSNPPPSSKPEPRSEGSFYVITNKVILEVSPTEAFPRLRLAAIRSARKEEFSGASEALGTSSCYVQVELFDGREERIHFQAGKTGAYFSGLLGRIGHLNKRTELKCMLQEENAPEPSDQKEGKGKRQSSSPVKHEEVVFSVLIRKHRSWERAVVKLLHGELYIARLQPLSMTLTAAAGGPAGAVAWASSTRKPLANDNQVREIPMRSRRYEDVAWLHLSDLKSVAIGFTSGDCVTVYLRNAALLRRNLASRISIAHNRRRAHLFRRAGQTQLTSYLTRPSPCSPATSPTSASSFSSPVSNASQRPCSPTSMSTTTMSRASSCQNLSSKGSSNSLCKINSDPAVSKFNSSPMPECWSYRPRMQRSIEDIQLVQQFVEFAILDSQTSASRVRRAFLKRSLELGPGEGLQGGEAACEATRDTVERISGLVCKSVDELNIPNESSKKFFKLLHEKSGEVWTLIDRYVMQLVAPPLSASILRSIGNDPDVRKQNKVFKSKSRQLRCKPQSFFGINPESRGRWSLAIHEVGALERSTVTTPWDKIAILLDTVHAIQLEFTAVNDPPDSSSQGTLSESNSTIDVQEKKNRRLSLCADEFLPIFIYVLVNAPLQRPYTWLKFIRAMTSNVARGETCSLNGEEEYYLTMFEASLEYIRSVQCY